MVKVYDSMRTSDVNISTKECIATLLNCQSKFVYILFPEVQQQTGAASCGLFALAYAYSLCEGLDPSQLVYESSKFRSHFSHCIEKQNLISKQPSTSLRSLYQLSLGCIAFVGCLIRVTKWCVVIHVPNGTISLVYALCQNLNLALLGTAPLVPSNLMHFSNVC